MFSFAFFIFFFPELETVLNERLTLSIQSPRVLRQGRAALKSLYHVEAAALPDLGSSLPPGQTPPRLRHRRCGAAPWRGRTGKEVASPTTTRKL